MHIIKRLSVMLTAGLTLVSCRDMTNTLVKPDTPLPLAWQAGVTTYITRPAVADGLVFIVDEQSTLRALDVATGKPAWSAKFDRLPRSDDPIGVDAGRAFVVNNGEQGRIIALDAKTGKKAWEIALGKANVIRHPVAAGGRMFFVSPAENNAESVRAMDAATGKDVWAVKLDGYGGTALIARAGMLFIGVNTWDGANVKMRRMVALDAATGAVKWDAPLDLNFAGGIDADADRVAIGMDGGVVQSRSASDGTALWTARLGGRISAPPTAINGVVFAANSDGVIAALNAGDGTEVWKRDVSSAILTQVAVADGVAYFGTNDGYLHAVDAATGAEKWKVQSPEREAVGVGKLQPPVSITPVIAGDLLLTYNTNALNALKLH